MDRSFIFKALLAFILVLPLVTRASISTKKETMSISYCLKNGFVFLIDTEKYQRQDEKKEKSKKNLDIKDKPVNKQAIKEVPKARKQSRPLVVKANIKVKPIKVIRPHIKRP